MVVFSYINLYLKKKSNFGQSSSLSPMYYDYYKREGGSDTGIPWKHACGGNVRLPSGILRPNVAEAGAGGRKHNKNKNNTVTPT